MVQPHVRILTLRIGEENAGNAERWGFAGSDGARVCPIFPICTRLHAELQRRRERLRGGGGLGDAERQLLEPNPSPQWEDDDDAWLRHELQSKLAKPKSAGGLMACLRRILEEANTWTMQSSSPERKASRRHMGKPNAKTSQPQERAAQNRGKNQQGKTRQPAWFQTDPCFGSRGIAGRWTRSLQSRFGRQQCDC